MEEEYTYERLEALRKVTKLGLKLVVLKNKIKKLEKLNPTINISNDDEILKLEYNIRMKKWINSCEKDWIRYLKIENDGCGLFEYANGILNRMVEEQKKKVR